MKEHYDDLDEYIADLKSEIASNDKCANHYYNLGLALLSKRDFVAAEEALLNAVRNSPHLAEAYVQLGGICLERGDLDGAACAIMKKPPIAGPNSLSPGATSLRPFAARPAGTRPLRPWRKALKWDPDFVQAKNALATAYFMKGDFTACEETCKELIKQEPGFAPAWNNLALAYFEQQQYAKAAEAADKAQELGFEVPEGFLEELKPHR